MIDTDKYEGHTEGKWKLHYDDSAIDGDYLEHGAQLDPVGALHPMSVANAQLIADAPLLLAEVKRLHSILDNIEDIDMNWGIDFNGATITVTHFTGLMLSGELKLEMIE